MREKIEASVEAASRAASIALQKADIASSRTQTAQERSEAAEEMANRARGDCDVARITASQFDPNFIQPGVQALRRHRDPHKAMLNHIAGHANHVSFDSMLSNTSTSVGGPPSIAALGARSTQSYQHIPMGNKGGAPLMPNHQAHNRVAESQHQLDKYSRSFDYALPVPSTSTNIVAGHVNDNYEQQLHAQHYGAAGVNPPAPLHHTTSTNNAAGPDDYRINDGASTVCLLTQKNTSEPFFCFRAPG